MRFMNQLNDIRENIEVIDFYRAETELDAVIYRLEFEKSWKIFQDSQSEERLVFCFLFLQIYIECFLHQNMRRVVELEFKPPRDQVCDAWLKGERRHIPQKIEAFVSTFFSPGGTTKIETWNEIQQLVEIIKSKFKRISNTRNLFAHGHKISEWSDSNGGSGKSQARSLLTENQLNKTIREINEIGEAWNQLLEIIIVQCKALRQVGSFKFQKYAK